MRWIWIDRFVEFDSGKRAVSIKNLSLAEEHLHDHFPGCPIMPNSLITEGLAQTGGLLVGETFAFARKVVLAKIPKAQYFFAARPGDTLQYECVLDHVSDDGATVKATSRVGSHVQAEMEIFYAVLPESSDPHAQAQQQSFVFTLRLLGVFDVGRDSNGRGKIEPPGLAQLRASGILI
jgi:3-hydroxyacyl-[acyl-carrier-protein] dehydratase